MVEDTLNSGSLTIQPLPTLQSLADDWLTPQQLQEQLGISIRLQEVMRSKKRQLKDECPLPFCKFGKFVRYNKIRIYQWLLNNEIRVKEEAMHE